MALGLVPEILDPIDVVVLFCEGLGMVDPEMTKAGHIEYVIGSKRIGIDDAIGHDLAFEDRVESASAGIGNHACIYLSAAF